MTDLSKLPTVLTIHNTQQQDAEHDSKLTIAHHDCQPVALTVTQSVQALLQDLPAFEQSHAIKLGTISDLQTAQAVSDALAQLPNIPVVFEWHAPRELSNALVSFIQQNLLPKVNVLVTNKDGLAQLANVQALIDQQAKDVLEMGVTHCLVCDVQAETAYATDYFANQDTAFYCYQTKGTHDAANNAASVIASSIASHLASGQDVRDAVVLAKAYLARGQRLSDAAGITHSQEALALEDLPKLCYQADFVGKQLSFPDCPEHLGIYPVVDTADWVQKLVDCGVATIQLRVKDQPQAVLDQQIKQAVDYLSDKAVSFFVNDYWQLAIQHQAYGVHLGQEDLHDAKIEAIAEAGLRLGVSTHSYWELARALAVNPSYIALGPIYATTSKQMPFSPQGEARLQQWVHLLADHYPLVAIGGIDFPRTKQLKKTGVGSVAMISAITKADDYQKATMDFLNFWERGQ